MIIQKLPTAYHIPYFSQDDRDQLRVAQRQAYRVIGRNPTLLYRMVGTGQWSWAWPESPIASQIAESGEACLGAPVDRCYLVTGT